MEMPLSFQSTTRETSEMTKTASSIPTQSESDIPSLNLRQRSISVSGYQCKAADPPVSNPPPKPVAVDEEQSVKRLDRRAAAWEILELSNSRIGSNPSSILYSALGDSVRAAHSLTSTAGRHRAKNRQQLYSNLSPVASNLNFADSACPEDTVDTFMMLRFAELTPERKRPSEDDTDLKNGGIYYTCCIVYYEFHFGNAVRDLLLEL